jgi:hypothetical protein
MSASYHLRRRRASPSQTPTWALLVLPLLALACTRPGYLEIQLTLPQSPVDLAQQVEWLDLSATDGTPSDAGPRRIPSSPVAGGLGVAYPKLIVAVSAPAGSQVDVMINGLNAAGSPIASASGSKTVGAGTASLELTLSTHCQSVRDCDPNAVCQGVEGCDADSRVGFGACIAENAGVPDAGTPCGPFDAGHCDGTGTCLLAYCGSGRVDPDAGEQCDWGAANSDTLPDHCRTDCQLPHCGDGVVDPDAGEICDFDAGHNGQGLGCNATCNLFGEVTTLVSDAGLGTPYGLALVGRSLYVADTSFHVIRRLDLATGAMLTMAGQDADLCLDADGVGTAAAFCQLSALLPFDGGVLIADQAALRLMVPNPALDAGAVTTLAGSIGDGGPPPVGFEAGSFASALYATPYGMTQIGDVLYTNAHTADLIAASDLASRQVSFVASAGSGIFLNGMTGIGRVVYTSAGDGILSLDTGIATPRAVSVGGPIAAGAPDGLCTDGKTIYVCMGDHTVRQLDPRTAELSLVAGSPTTAAILDGLGADAGFVDPANCAWDPVAQALYVSDRNGQAIRKIR